MPSIKDRCAGCGKEILSGSSAVRISLGSPKEPGVSFEETSLWGLMHRACFGKAIDDPQDALAEIRRLAGKS